MEFLGMTFEIGFWTDEKLSQIIAIDTETTWIDHASVTPDIVTCQVFDGSGRVYFVERHDLVRFFEVHSSATFIFHNAAFDIDVIIKATNPDLKACFEELVENMQVWDTSILYRLWKLATVGQVPFKYNLALLSEELLGHKLDKNAEIRGNFGDYLCNNEVYWDQMPDEFVNYAAMDAISTYYCYQQLCKAIAPLHSHSHLTHLIQLCGDIALSRMTKRGIGFDVAARNQMVNEIEAEMQPYLDILASYGWVRGTKGIQERYEYIVRDLLELDLPKTEDGHISMASEDLEPYCELHPFVHALVQYGDLEHKLQYVEPLTAQRIHPRYDLIKNTGRTGASKPNVQNPPRNGNIRDLFVAADGYTFVIADYNFVELCTLAQTTYTLYGHSSLRDAINEGLDPHKYYASIMTGKDIKDITKEERQYAKAANFGFPGGLGIEKFTEYASKSYNVHLTAKEADKMKSAWFKAYPEMDQYMKEVSSTTTTLTGRIRSDASYCASKNTPFQGLAADGAKIMLWELEKRNFRSVCFVHDAVIVEVLEETAEQDQKIIEKIMVDAMMQCTPDVQIRVEGYISKKWIK